jgi:site-specific recombinase XerC
MILAAQHRLGKRYVAHPLSTADLEALVGAIKPSSLGRRNSAALGLLAFCGLRCAEVTHLRADALDLAAGVVWVLDGAKGGRQRAVGVGPRCAELVAPWLDERARRGLPSDGRLISRLDGTAISEDALRSVLARLAVKAKVGRRVHPHALRHTFASVAARQISLFALQNALGHRHLSSTATYVATLGGDSIDAVKAIDWR